MMKRASESSSARALHLFSLEREVSIERCREVILNCPDLESFRRYTLGVVASLRSGDDSRVEEAIRVALPLCYRLALDDTQHGEHLGSEIKNLSARLLYPHFYQALECEIEQLTSSSLDTSYSDLADLLNALSSALEAWSLNLSPEIKVYGRVKSPYSIYEKFCNYLSGNKLPLGEGERKLTERQAQCIHTFINHVETYSEPKRPTIYSLDTVQWLLPDLIGMTVHVISRRGEQVNFGSAKQTYRGIFRKLREAFPGDIYCGPRFSRHWHMKRLTAAFMWESQGQRIPVEVLIRNDADYLLGYANYWRYKGVPLFDSSHLERREARRRAIRRIKQHQSIRSVQESLFRDLREGQLLLF